MRPRLRLKAKLVIAISTLVLAVVTTLSLIYIAALVRHHVRDANDSAEVIANQIYHLTRQALEVDLSGARLDPENPQALHNAIAETLQTDPGLNALLQSVIGYSPTILDAAIADAEGHALLHTDPSKFGSTLPERELFSTLVRSSFRQQLRLITQAPRVYEVRIPLERDGAPFGSVRVGLSTVFLKSQIEPQLRTAIAFSGISITVALLLAIVLSNFALRPLAQIARRLDQMSADVGGHAAEPAPPRIDEYGAVNTRIDRLGRQVRDVKEVFSALKENLDQIMANLQDGLMLFTRDWRVVLVSAQAEQFAGKPRSEILGRYVHEVFAADSRLGSVVLDAFHAHRPLDQIEIEIENGSRVQVSLDFIEERGERMGALITMRDAESVRRIEDEIELSRRLAAIGRLTSGVAHEVKNPINAIVVHLEVLRQKLHSADPQTRRHMDVIGSEIQRLDRVVQTLVDFTRPMELRLAHTDLRRIVDDVVLLASPDAERHGVRIEQQAAAVPLPAKVDSDLFKQALLNVMLNGVQAMPQGGTLFISADRNGDSALVEVRDQGVGIAPELRDRIFNLYFTTKKGGSGIGLAMTYRVMQMHNGSVEFDSVPQQGTTFRLRLPLAEAHHGVLQDVAAGS